MGTRSWTVLLAACALVGVSLAGGASTASAATAGPNAWATNGYDAGQSFWNSGETTQTPARVKALKLNFTIPTAADPDPGADCLFPVPPVEASGRLFDVGPDGVSAYNQWTGQRLWNYPIPAYEEFIPQLQIIGANLVVSVTGNCNSETGGSSSVVFVLNTTTGAPAHPAWETSNGGVSRMVAVSGTLVTAEYQAECGGGCSSSWVVGYSLAGKKLWATPSGWSTGSSAVLFGAAVSGGGLVYAINPAGKMAALRVSNGSVAWTASRAVQPVAWSQDGLDLYAVDGSGNLYDYNPKTGQPKGWGEAAGRASSVGWQAVDATTIFTNCSGGALCATRRTDGHSLWTVAGGCASADPYSPGQAPIVAASVVYCSGSTFYATTGKRISSAADGTPVTSVAGGRVYGLQTEPVTGVRDVVSFK
jgi:hypothetical protein